MKELEKIPINKIEPNQSQPRKNFNEDSLQELADSIKQHGLIEPLIVQKGKKGFYQIIAGERRWRAAKIAGKVSKSRVAITNALRLLKLDERVRTMLVEDKLKSGHARALLAIENNDLQYETAVQVFDQKLSVRETEKLVKKILLPKAEKKEDEKNNDAQMKTIYQNFEEKLKMIMGTKVNINHGKKGKGKIEIEYYSPDEFDRIMELMTKIADKN